MKSVQERLESLRAYLKHNNIQAIIIPSGDPHQSEYAANHWETRRYFSGFTGTAGTLVVTADHAGLWTDSRYFAQAEIELEGILLMKQSVPHAPEHVEWLFQNLEPDARIGVEGTVFSIAEVTYLQNEFAQKQIEVVDISGYLQGLWPNRQEIPSSKIFEHDIQFAGKTRKEKLSELTNELPNDSSLLVIALDEIAWVLNIRASDLPFTPVALSYFFFNGQNSIWFVDRERVPQNVLHDLKNDGIETRPYKDIESFLESLDKNQLVHVYADGLSWSLQRALGKNGVYSQAYVQDAMSIKNDGEIANTRKVMAKDGAALTKAFMWLETTLKERAVPETEFAQIIQKSRASMPHYIGESFDAVVGYRANGAIVHYTAAEGTCAEIEQSGILLVDSGGQYLDGTTDITRTICLGEASAEERTNYTLVLKGNLALQNQRFPKGTVGMQLDTLARMHLWNQGLNFGHGTGHGVGFFLRVHEPPQGFATSTTTSRGTTAFKAGMVTTNEPGFYKEGAYGIRIENVMLCAESRDGFLEHEALTLFPIETNWLDKSLITSDEIEWLNQYHEKVYAQVSPLLNAEESAWLKAKCQVIS